MYAEIIVDIAAEQVDRVFTYRVPEGMTLLPGTAWVFTCGRWGISMRSLPVSRKVMKLWALSVRQALWQVSVKAGRMPKWTLSKQALISCPPIIRQRKYAN